MAIFLLGCAIWSSILSLGFLGEYISDYHKDKQETSQITILLVSSIATSVLWAFFYACS